MTDTLQKRGLTSGVQIRHTPVFSLSRDLEIAQNDYFQTGVCHYHGKYTANLQQATGSRWFVGGEVDDDIEVVQVQICLVCGVIIKSIDPDVEPDF